MNVSASKSNKYHFDIKTSSQDKTKNEKFIHKNELKKCIKGSPRCRRTIFDRITFKENFHFNRISFLYSINNLVSRKGKWIMLFSHLGYIKYFISWTDLKTSKSKIRNHIKSFNTNHLAPGPWCFPAAILRKKQKLVIRNQPMVCVSVFSFLDHRR